jgi:hypothetical protein
MRKSSRLPDECVAFELTKEVLDLPVGTILEFVDDVGYWSTMIRCRVVRNRFGSQYGFFAHELRPLTRSARAALKLVKP